MKLEEITKIASQSSGGFNLSDFDTQNAVQIGTAENLPIYHFKGGQKDPALEAYAIKIDDQFVSVLIGKKGTLNGPAFFIHRTYTIPSMRNKGLVSSLYSALYSKYHIRLVGDTEQSPETISVWKKLSQILPVKVFDPSKKQIVDLSTISDTDLYNPALNLRFILEDMELQENFKFPSKASNILEDYVIYTHITVIGKYL